MSCPISYTTYSTPGWSIARIAVRAAALGFEAVELRAYDGANVPADLDAAACAEMRRTFEGHGLGVSAVGTSCRFAPSAEEAARSVEDGLRYIEIASRLGAPLIRVFGGAFERAGVSEDDAVGRVAESLSRLAEPARQAGVRVALETHDGFSAGALVGRALRQVNHPSVGACWDWLHPFRVGETPRQTAEHLRGFLIHAHTKDARRDEQGRWQAEHFGHGILPLGDIYAEMAAQGYDGPLSFEWERGGDPDPEEALRRYVQGIRALLAAAPR
jgi:sugar phosphate isomerase/epimerase